MKSFPSSSLRKINAWRLITAFWQSEKRGYAYLALMGLIIMTLALVGINVIITYWYKHFWNALQNYHERLIFQLVGVFCVIAASYVIIAVYQYYIQSIFKLRWRQWLTDVLIQRWLSNKSYYYLESFDHYTDNPDQRIQEDADQLVNYSLDLFLGVINAVVTICSFVVVLWTLSGSIRIPLGQLGHVTIHGYLVWIALVYSVLGTYLTHKIGKPLIQLNFNKERREADFRFNAVRLRANAENLALYKAEDNEHQSILAVFAKVVEITRQVIQRQKLLLYFTAGFNQISVIIPLLAALPMYLGKKIQIGGIMQITTAFARVQDSMSFIVTAYTTIAAWRAVVLRLTKFLDNIDKAEQAYAEQKDFTIDKHAQNTIIGQNLQVETQTGDVLFKNYHIEFQAGKRYLIRGPSGIGKSTLIKVIAGIWPFAKGVVKLPNNKKIMYLPQRSYLPLGSLREILLFPQTTSASDDQLQYWLQEVGLAKLIDQLDTVKNWSEILSLGEQQKVAFIRLFLCQPDWIFLDESTSSLDMENEKRLYQLLVEKLPNSTIISVAHRESVRDLHDIEIDFQKGLTEQ